MSDNKHNSWANFETWIINYWGDNDEAIYIHRREIAQEEYDDAEADEYSTRDEIATRNLADRLKAAHEDARDGIMGGDYAATIPEEHLAKTPLDNVDWYEIAEHLLKSVDRHD